MGAKQTKIDGSYLPDTPTMQRISNRSLELQSISSQADERMRNISHEDPRSPHEARTPINTSRQCDVAVMQTNTENIEQKPFYSLRKRLLKTFTYNLNDPRSPNLNRTPLFFDNSHDKTLNLDDTFADLFIESRAPPVEGKSVISNIDGMDITSNKDINSTMETDISETENANVNLLFFEEETMASPAILKPTTFSAQQPIDPRSPTVGVDRTPIIFNDDDTDEDILLESILTTLSLSGSNQQNSKIDSADNKLREKNVISKLENKHLEYVRNEKRRGRTQVKTRRVRHNRVYEDGENFKSTPKKSPMSKNNRENAMNIKRTPLSCLKNRSAIRSRSMEGALKETIVTSNLDVSLNFNEKL